MAVLFFCIKILFMTKHLFILLSFFTFSLSFAQSGRISGTILDAKTAEALPGAMVVVEGTGKGAVADFDGKFAINNVAAGKVTLIVSYISYDTKKITDVNVIANDVTDVAIQMNPSASQDLGEVEVVVTLNKENNTALVLQQKNNASVSDGISAETIKRSPDKSTSDVLKRVSGASIQDNKFAIVRGLNERYNAAYLNGAPLPSTESDRKAFSFDIFPSNMLDNLVITKTARPDMPGEFAGGIIDITTKNIPEKNFFSVSVSGGYNTITTNKTQLYNKGGKKDWMGIDDGTRAIPEGIPSFTSYPVNIHEQAKLAQDISPSDWGIYSKKFSPNSSFQMATGFNFKHKEKDFIGVLGSISYNNTNTYFTTERISYQSGIPNDPSNPLLLDKNFVDKTFQNQKLIGALLNATCKINENNNVSVKNLYSVNTDDRTIQRDGSTTPNEANPNIVRSTAFWYTQNNISSSQFIGDHYIPKAKLKINWNGNYSHVTRTVPNLRRHYYTKLTYLENKQSDPSEPPIYDPTDTTYKAELAGAGSTNNEFSGLMIWSKLDEYIKSGKADVSRSFKISEKLTIEPKVGGLYQVRDRNFDYRQFAYVTYGGSGGTTVFNGSLVTLPANEIFTSQNMGIMTPSTTSYPYNIGGFKLVETTQPQSDYRAGSKLFASYALIDLRYTKYFRFVGGARYESYNQKLIYHDNLYKINLTDITQDTTVNDVLPSANLIYSPTDKINIRGSYSKTLNRPEFRELAPFIFYDFNTQFSLNGNPNLKRAQIDNYDLRFEWYPGAGQLLSVSGFYKKFTNPIELFQSQNAQQIEYKNVPSAFAEGCEFEYRINIGNFYKNDSNFIGKLLNNLTIFSNLALIKSEVDITNLQGATYKRPLQGQSPYLFNAGISYVDNKNNFSISAMGNRIGPRIYVVGNNLYQEVWEYSRTVVDLQATKSFLKNKLELRFTIKDLLAKGQPLKYFQNYDSKAFDYKNGNYTPFWITRLGTTYSFQLSYRF